MADESHCCLRNSRAKMESMSGKSFWFEALGDESINAITILAGFMITNSIGIVHLSFIPNREA